MQVRATITSKGQVTIPLEVRKRLGLQQGDAIDFIIEDGVTYVRPARAAGNPFDAYVGALGELASADEVRAWLRDLRDED